MASLVERWLAAPDTIGEAFGRLPDELGDEAEAQWATLTLAHPPLQLGTRNVPLDQPQVMGILNVTPDSFSDGGRFLDDAEAGRAPRRRHGRSGGGDHRRGRRKHAPGAKPLWEGDEIKRVVPAIEACAGMGAAVSDTRSGGDGSRAGSGRPSGQRRLGPRGMIPRSAEVVAQAGCPVVLMHAPGAAGEDLHTGADYISVVFDVFDALRARRAAQKRGSRRSISCSIRGSASARAWRRTSR